MFLDRIAASKVYLGDAYTSDAPLAYYENGRADELMHKDTRELLEKLLHSRQKVRSLQTIINPVFIMVFVPAFVVEPCGRIPFFFPFGIIRASCPLIVSASHTEFCPTDLYS